ncbi:MAG: DegV family protein [Bacteroidota bacterium]
MPPVAVLTDSVASLPEEIIQQLNIRTVAYYIHRGEEILRDLVTIQREEFLRWLMTAHFLPTTASPGPGDYFEAYDDLARKGVREIISIHISSLVSGAVQGASVACTMMKDRFPDVSIEIVDTRTAGLCQGLMVLEAGRLAAAGARLEEIAAQVRKMIPVTRMIQTADTLKYLYMGGRIGKAQELAGSLLNIKPLIGIENGIIAPLGKAHSRGQAYRLMAEMVSGAVGRGKARIAYMHAGAQREVEKIRELVEAKVDVVESFIAELSPALAVHTGPGTAGLCFHPVE